MLRTNGDKMAVYTKIGQEPLLVDENHNCELYRLIFVLATRQLRGHFVVFGIFTFLCLSLPFCALLRYLYRICTVLRIFSTIVEDFPSDILNLKIQDTRYYGYACATHACPGIFNFQCTTSARSSSLFCAQHEFVLLLP